MKFFISLILISICCNNSFAKSFKDVFFDKTYKDDPNFKRHVLDLEAGVVAPIFNEVGSGSASGHGTFFLSNIQNPANPYARYSYYFNLDKKNSFRVLVAPLAYSGRGVLGQDVQYYDQNFTGGEMTDYSYKFNSYRFSYIRNFYEENNLTIKLGLTVKIRDASILVSQGNLSHLETDLGIVPILIYFNIDYKMFDKKLTIGVEGDAIGAPQGSAVDIAAFARYKFNENVEMGPMYRILYGGADVSRVYAYASANYFGASLRIGF